ncbi:T9SS type A sorting domain-containing protein [bacterium]
MKTSCTLIIILFLFGSGIGLHSQELFQAIHCEPNHADLFPKLIELVELADSVGLPLTIMFTPQWAQRIIDTPDFLMRVRQWQLNGHEIACHHHGVEAGGSWDGYTNQLEASWPKPADFYRGDMNAYYDILNQAAGDSLMLTSCMAAGDYDWPAGLIYLTSGHAVEHATTQPELMSFFGQDVYELGHGLIKMVSDVENMIQSYSQAETDDVFGAVTHVNNFNTSETYLRLWFEFIKNKPVKTVRQIMRERGLVPVRVSISEKLFSGPKQYEINPAFPNPFNPKTTIRLYIPKPSHLSIRLFDIRGNYLETIVQDELPAGSFQFSWDGSDYSSGVYLLKSVYGKQIQNQKLHLIK